MNNLNNIKSLVTNPIRPSYSEHFLKSVTQKEFFGFSLKIPLTKKQIRRIKIRDAVKTLGLKEKSYTIKLKNGMLGIRTMFV